MTSLFGKALGGPADYTTRNKSLYAVREALSEGIVNRKGTACAVEKNRNGSSDYYLLTWCGVVGQKRIDEKKIVADRYCSQYPDHKANHRIEVLKVLEKGDFTFVCVEKKPEFCVRLVDNYQDDERSSFSAFTFSGSNVVRLEFVYSYDKRKYEVSMIDGELEKTTAVGSPIIVEVNREFLCVGVLGILATKELFPVFLTKSALETTSADRSSISDKYPTTNEVTEETKSEEKVPLTCNEPSNRDETISADRSSISDKYPTTNEVTEETTSEKKLPLTCNEPSNRDASQESVSSLQELQLSLPVQVSQSEVPPKEETDSAKPLVEGATANIKSKVDEPIKEDTTSTLFENPTTCIKEKLVDFLPAEVWNELEIKLDPEQESAADFRSLATEYGYDAKYITFLKEKSSPTESLLKNHTPSLPTIADLHEKLQKIGRSDVNQEVLDKWLDEFGCNCVDCESLC